MDDQLNMHRSTIENGVVLKEPVPQPPLHQNPPLQALNVAYRTAEAEMRDDVEHAAKAAGGAVKGVLLNRPSGGARRAQKPLRLPPQRG